MTKTSWVEICVSDFEQSITWFENVLGFRVVAREGNEYAELSRGETSIQLATDQALYWEPERQHLLPSGQRGSGVEIVLLVDNVDAVYHQAEQAHAEIVRPLADQPWHMRQFWVRHPDGYLIRPAQRLLSVNPTIYHRQIADAFRDDRPRIAEELLAIKQTGDQFVQQQDYLGAATVYGILVMEIFDRSNLYYDEEEEYDDYDDYYESERRYRPEEEGLDDLVKECIQALGNCLADERADRMAREKIIDVLFEIYDHDMTSGSKGFAASAADLLVKHTTPLERHTIAEWVREALAGEEEEITDSQRKEYGKFLLDLEKDTLDDEAYLQICRETGRTSDAIDRLLTLGRVDEAVSETQSVDDGALLGLADLFIQHGQEAVAERLVRERAQKTQNLQLLKWLKQFYQTRNNHAAALEIAETIFRRYPNLADYKEIRDLASQLGRWGTLRPELLDFLDKPQYTTLLIQIALDEGDIDKALELVKAEQQKQTPSSGSYYYRYYDMPIRVAQAAEETRPREAIELYRQQAEGLIAQRGRQNYQAACRHLARMRTLYERLGESSMWTNYIARLREENRSLRALKEELAKAGL